MTTTEVALFHTEIRLPAGFVKPTGTVSVVWSRHAKQRANQKRIMLPVMVNLDRFQVIEVGVHEGEVFKILFRGALDSKRDLCMVLKPKGRAWAGITVWDQQKNDQHRTLDRSRYVQ